MNLTDFIGAVAGVLTTIAFIPQVVKIWRTRSARDISYGMYTCFIGGVGLWLCYGLLIGAIPIVLNNAIVLVLAILVIFFKYKVEKNDNS
ncbi:Sugar transporter SemiSWEET [bioreactor metagenome]|uniref:Sugar transporter SemiSWEET n=1 Tax=bioreactor metagenome TaxID=1076179 RepID=A0A645AQU8_9ZZZZ